MRNKAIIITDRLWLREFELGDASSFFDLNNQEEVMRYTGDVPFNDVAESEDLIANYSHYSEYGFGRWTVLDKENNTILGWCGLKYHPEESYVDLGYRFHQKYWGNGFATEAAKACLDYGFNELKFDEIVGRTSMHNLASVRVLEKIGMTFWKKAPCEGIEDSLYYRKYKA